MKGFLCALEIVALSLAWAPFAAAQVPDHLKCYKIKDPLAKAQYTADLSGSSPLPADSGCLIKVPGKLLCVATEKTNVNPAPPGGVSGGDAGRFVCYKVKCPKAVLTGIPFADQFGTRTLQPKVPTMVCAPEPVDEGPCVTGGCAPCGACGDGVCHAQGGGGGCGAPTSTPQCVSASTCTSVICNMMTPCAGAGQVCVFTGSGVGSLCCNPCP